MDYTPVEFNNYREDAKMVYAKLEDYDIKSSFSARAFNTTSGNIEVQIRVGVIRFDLYTKTKEIALELIRKVENIITTPRCDRRGIEISVCNDHTSIISIFERDEGLMMDRFRFDYATGEFGTELKIPYEEDKNESTNRIHKEYE